MAIMAKIFDSKEESDLSSWTMRIIANKMWDHPKLKNLDPLDEKQCAFYEARVYHVVECLVRNPKFSHEKRVAIISLTRCVDTVMEVLPKAKPYVKPRQTKRPTKANLPWWVMPRPTYPVKGKNLLKELGE